MATKIFCDQCGTEGASSYSVEFRGNLGNKEQRDFSFQACNSCWERASTAIKAIVPAVAIND
jgi:hypothetical protein